MKKGAERREREEKEKEGEGERGEKFLSFHSS